MTTKAKSYRIGAVFVLAVCFSVSPTHAAKVMLRLHEDDGQYSGFPDSYPVCKAKMDYMHFDGTPTLDKRNLFDTKVGWIEIGVYAVGGVFNGTEVLNRLRTYESNGMEVAGVSLYREDWLSTDTPGGAFPADWRILSAAEISAVRNAIATANPPLRCRDTLKVIQLLGAGSGAWGAGSAGDFPVMSEAVKEHFRLFDGLGVECHIGDHEPGNRQSVITAMAAISKWAADNGKTTFVFMGGGAQTYEDLPRTQLTYRYLWSEMFKLGVDYRSENCVYFRQGAWGGGKHTPESAYNTLTHQQRWVIHTLKPAPGNPVTSLFVSEVQDQNMTADTTAVVPFIVGEAEMDADALTVSAVSANPTLVPNANLRFRGRGTDRLLAITPAPGQTGSSVITLTVSDGSVNMSTSFLLTVTPFHARAAVLSGDINDSNTWNGVTVPTAGDSATWQTGNRAVNMSATNTATFCGGTFEVQAGGQFAPGVPAANLTLNKLILSGGTIQMGNNSGLDMDLSGHTFKLDSGTVKTGNGSTMDVVFKNGFLAGGGPINIAGSGTGGANVEFQSSVKTLGFTGTFNVATSGVLNLPAIPNDNASFGLSLSGTGKYANDADVALTSLTIAGGAFANGTYAYTNFTAAQQAFLVTNTGTITVISDTPPTLGSLEDVITNEDTPTSISFSVGDGETAAGSLVVSGFAYDLALVPIANLSFGGSGPNRLVTLTPALNQSGTTTVTLAVNDGWLTTVGTFTLTVNSVNDAPMIGHVTNQTVYENASTDALPFSIGDAETALSALTLTIASSNTNLVPSANVVLLGTGAARTVTVTPAVGETGTATITLIVSDGMLAATNSFGITVNADPDSDGDGMGDAAETAAGRNPGRASDLAFEFNTAGAFEGWGSFANMTGQNVTEGALKGQTVTGDPQLTHRGFDFSSASVPSLVVKVKAGTVGTTQLYWGYVGAPGFASTKRVNGTYGPSANVWQAVLFPLSAHTEWIGKTIANLRVDPINTSGTAFEIDWIRASDGDLDSDGVPDVSEGVGDSDGDGLLDIEDPNGLYEQWAASYGLTGGRTGNDDGDSLSNVYEYGLGGNPTNAADRGYLPTCRLYADGGINWFEYVYARRRSAASGITYSMEVADSLGTPTWTSSGVEVAGEGALDSEFNAVTNRVSTEGKSKQFIRLIIE